MKSKESIFFPHVYQLGWKVDIAAFSKIADR